MERWDLLDDDRRLTGETLRRGEPLPPGRFHTIIGVWTIHDRRRCPRGARRNRHGLPL